MMPIEIPKMNFPTRSTPRLVSTDAGFADTKVTAVAVYKVDE